MGVIRVPAIHAIIPTMKVLLIFWRRWSAIPIQRTHLNVNLVPPPTYQPVYLSWTTHDHYIFYISMNCHASFSESDLCRLAWLPISKLPTPTTTPQQPPTNQSNNVKNSPENQPKQKGRQHASPKPGVNYWVRQWRPRAPSNRDATSTLSNIAWSPPNFIMERRNSTR